MKLPVFAQILCFKNPGDPGYTMVKVDKGNIKFDTARNITLEEYKKIIGELRGDASKAAQARHLQNKIKNRRTFQCPAPFKIEEPRDQVICQVAHTQTEKGDSTLEDLLKFSLGNPLAESPQDADFSTLGNDFQDFELDPTPDDQSTDEEFPEYF
ncbi:hypothetical protein TVAG_196280 [Trichomonas vaginalis G3]|uniref:Uncharacterized protein n=1 Tax=Trichomonas vaginalis (strain ATCC PRA-98 / G3) TaxID=412133 RepID=A2F4W0_TRIV3|nr:hypothetical protein TVAGG3_0088440 [Trichomonas vaginalis G3]EAY00068.1 hypothetical protein TVAG_196280 [Trichomonas vaginalis G3]KAI5543739.1 hypothetical protein TVAGG3_0088440 [Trichomonas vaginalis G3]|eukprot:XP_001312997.1 hypothetical protein [Trichomonas vaginalis G3]